MGNNILHHFAKAHTGYLHARGKASTDILLAMLAPEDNESILELGFGTGATLVQLAAENEKVHCYGLERSPLMFQKAQDRIRFCGLSKRIRLALSSSINQFPYPDDTFNKVYVESVLAIQEGMDLVNMLLEIQRVLKQNGILILNETLWLESTDRETAKRINIDNKRIYGIIQSNHEYAYLDDWKKLLADIGFVAQLDFRLSALSAASMTKAINIPILLSRLFSLLGKVKLKLSPSMIKESRQYYSAVPSFDPHEKLMEGIILKVINQK